jgi:hypothetical protein
MKNAADAPRAARDAPQSITSILRRSGTISANVVHSCCGVEKLGLMAHAPL